MTPHVSTAHEIETASGRYFDLSTPRAQDVELEDIAHALSHLCRFNGHCRTFYSVAEHAVHVAEKLIAEGCAPYALAGLHHDDAEAYLGDIPRPIKPLLGDIYTKMTSDVDAVIHEALGKRWFVQDYSSPQIKAADNWMLAVEAREILPSRGEGWSGLPEPHWPLERMTLGLLPYEAKALYLQRHRELLGVSGKDDAPSEEAA